MTFKEMRELKAGKKVYYKDIKCIYLCSLYFVVYLYDYEKVFTINQVDSDFKLAKGTEPNIDFLKTKLTVVFGKHFTNEYISDTILPIKYGSMYTVDRNILFQVLKDYIWNIDIPFDSDIFGVKFTEEGIYFYSIVFLGRILYQIDRKCIITEFDKAMLELEKDGFFMNEAYK